MAEKKQRKFDFVTSDLIDFARSKGLSDEYIKNFVFMAQSEGAGKRENLFYTTPERVYQVFSKNSYFKGLTREQGIQKVIKNGLLRNEEKMANTFYGGRLGNVIDGDGWKFRGRTFVQLTGKENYEKIGKRLGVDLTSDPDILEKDPALARRVALEYVLWKDPKLTKGLTPRGMHQLIGPATAFEESMNRAGEIFEDGKLDFYLAENNALNALAKAEQQKVKKQDNRFPPMLPSEAKDWNTAYYVPVDIAKQVGLGIDMLTGKSDFAKDAPVSQRKWMIDNMMFNHDSSESIETQIEKQQAKKPKLGQ
jgi:predicted chitinase